MGMDSYDSWKTCLPDEVIHSFCNGCDGELYIGDEVITYEDENYCDKQCLLKSLDYSEVILEDFREEGCL